MQKASEPTPYRADLGDRQGPDSSGIQHAHTFIIHKSSYAFMQFDWMQHLKCDLQSWLSERCNHAFGLLCFARQDPVCNLEWSAGIVKTWVTAILYIGCCAKFCSWNLWKDALPVDDCDLLPTAVDCRLPRLMSSIHAVTTRIHCQPKSLSNKANTLCVRIGRSSLLKRYAFQRACKLVCFCTGLLCRGIRIASLSSKSLLGTSFCCEEFVTRR